MVAADKGKKQKVGERENEDDTERVLFAVEKLQDFQDELDKIGEEASDEVMALEQKYSAIRKPVYEKRKEAISTIPDFWLTAFLSHPALAVLLNEEDQKIFGYLSSLEVDDFTDIKTGYSISFFFKPNPFFEDTKLSKTFNFLDEGTTKVTATKIKWKEGMGLSNGVSDKKKGNKRPPTDESFFIWFSDIEFKNDVDDFEDEVADIIKDDLWPNPLTYFNNEDGSDSQEEDLLEDGSDSQEEDGEEDEGDD